MNVSDFQTKRTQNLEAQYKQQLDTLKEEFDIERYRVNSVI